MRLAFFILPSVALFQQVELYDATTVSQGGKPIGRLVFSKPDAKGLLAFDHLQIPGPITKCDQLTTRKIAKVFEDAENKSGSPLVVCRSLLASRSVQVTFDPQQKRFRCCITMKEGLDVYEAVGTTFQVEAKDEEIALRLAKRAVTEAMQEQPESAAELVKFFTGGCKIKKVVSNKLPPFTKVPDLMQAGEEKLAAAPIRLGKDEDTNEA